MENLENSRFHYTFEQKIRFLDLVHQGRLFEIAQDFPNINEQQLEYWKRIEPEMRKHITENPTVTKYTLHKGPPLKYAELYQYLYQEVK